MIERRRAESGKEPEPAVVPPVPYYSVKPKTELLLEQLVTSPFTVAIDAAQPPKDFTQQKFNQFEPAKIKALTHLVYYRQMMSLWNDNDTLMCRMFSSSLGALGLYWFHRLKQRSISSFKMLSASFLTRRKKTSTPCLASERRAWRCFRSTPTVTGRRSMTWTIVPNM